MDTDCDSPVFAHVRDSLRLDRAHGETSGPLMRSVHLTAIRLPARSDPAMVWSTDRIGWVGPAPAAGSRW